MAEINTPIKLERPVVEEAQKRLHAEKAIAHNHIRELNRITFDKIKDIVDISGLKPENSHLSIMTYSQLGRNPVLTAFLQEDPHYLDDYHRIFNELCNPYCELYDDLLKSRSIPEVNNKTDAFVTTAKYTNVDFTPTDGSNGRLPNSIIQGNHSIVNIANTIEQKITNCQSVMALLLFQELPDYVNPN